MLDSFYSRPFPTLDINKHYGLREQCDDDSPDFFEYYQNQQVTRYVLATKPTNLEEAKKEIHYCRTLFYKKGGIYWAVVDKKNNKMIGSIGLYTTNQHARGEICYDLSANYWKQGIMSSAVRTVLDYGFKTIKLARIEAHTIKVNHASIALLDKLGFIHEATLKRYRYFEGTFHDIEMYAKLRPTQQRTYRPQADFKAVLQQAITL